MKKKLTVLGTLFLSLFALGACAEKSKKPNSNDSAIVAPVDDSTNTPADNTQPSNDTPADNTQPSNDTPADNTQPSNDTPADNTSKLNSTEAVNAKDGLDYIKAKYGLDNHVYDVITIDRLDLLVEGAKKDQYGDSLIVFANSESEVAKEAIKKINEKAIALGVKRIYYFDFVLAGEYGVDLWDSPELTWPNVKTADGKNTQVTQAFVDAKNYLLANTSLKDVSSDYDANNDVFLFVNNHTEGKSEIKTSVLIEDKNDLKEDAVETLIRTLISENGEYLGTDYSDYDYFNNAIYRSGTTNGYYSSYEQFKDNFNVRSITYYELRLLLEQEGTHNILFSGSWCGDSKAAIALVVEDTAKYANGEPVYVFDFRLTNGVKSSNQTSVIEAEGKQSELVINGNASRNFITGVGHLGKVLIDTFDEFTVGDQNAQLSYVIGGYDNITLTEGAASVTYGVTTQKKFRSPSLFKYNKDAEKKVLDSWVHEVKDTDIVHQNYKGEQYIDYEFASGSLSEQQKAQGRYALATFFGAKEVKYNAPTINVSEADSSLDSGCGDDNDPIDNLNESTLIPNHGTTSYDVESYDLTIELIEGATAELAKFKGKAEIKAKANQDLTSISLDFRRQKITSITVLNLTKNVTVLDSVSANHSSISRVNIDNEDLQKLYIAAEIEANDEFLVTIEYETTTIDNATSSVEFGQFAEGFNVHQDKKGYTAVGEPFGSTYWFPNNNTPADGAKYTIKLIAPTDYTLISNGIRKSNNTNKTTGKRETVWEVTQDTASYQIFATFSKNITTFELSTYTVKNGVVSTNEYKTADDRYVPIYIYVNNDIYKANRYKIDKFIANLPKYINTLESKFGPYKGESLGFVFENVGDGHGENASWGAIETKDRPFFTNSQVVGESTFVHEFAHQWFGDAVRLNDWDNLWLNEGFATYGASLYYELTDETGEYKAESTYRQLYNSKPATSKLWAIAPANLPDESDLFGGQKSAYNRGALALAVLRYGLGDEAFFNIFSNWTTEFEGKSATTADFIQFVKDNKPSTVTNAEIDTFANVWLYGTTKPANFTLTGEANA